MTVWDTVSRLAQRLLGDAALQPTDLSKVEGRIIPEHGARKAKTFSSAVKVPSEIDVLPEYEFILQALQAGCPSIFVTGKAGTGKSTLVQWLCQKLESCAVVAPTAIAAVNVQGETIHSFFGLPPRHLDPDETYHPNARNRLVLENIKCLIIDEVSMVPPNVIDVMSNVLQGVRGNSQAFGGVPTVFVGDLLQLPPVVRTPEEAVYFSHRYRTSWFFSADVFKLQKIIPVNLTKVRRQSDNQFITALNQIRLNQDCRDAVAMFNRCCYRDKPKSTQPAVYLVPTNKAAKTINMRHLEGLPGKPVGYDAVVTGGMAASQWKLPVSDYLELKIGARVIFLKNKRPSWINGDSGEVVGLEVDHVRVKKSGSDNVLIVGKESWAKYRYTYSYQTKRIEQETVGTFEQLPVALGWAITIHKSQGLSLDSMVLDLDGGAFAAGQTYVALSRARTMEGITLARPISMRDVRSDPAVVQFYQALGIVE